VSVENNIYKIYNNGVRGYLNARYKLRDNQRRDVFVETVGDQDNWRFLEHSKNEYSLQNVKTGEYLYAILERNDRNLKYSDDPGRTTFTWDYSKEAIDDSAIWIIRKDCGLALSDMINKENLCFENKKSVGEFLYPSPNYHQKYVDLQESKFSGRVLTDFTSKNPPNWNKWLIIPVSKEDGIYRIYNGGTQGYLNVRSRLIDSDRRDVFVEKESDGDKWKLHSIKDNEFSLQNVRTGEYLYSILERNHPKFTYEGESGRTTYTWNYGREAVDRSAVWIIRANCDSGRIEGAFESPIPIEYFRTKS
jgi:hypothetical protein